MIIPEEEVNTTDHPSPEQLLLHITRIEQSLKELHHDQNQAYEQIVALRNHLGVRSALDYAIELHSPHS